MIAHCQQCKEFHALDKEMDTIIRHEVNGKRCGGSYKPSLEFIDSINDSASVTWFRGTIKQNGQVK